MVSDDDAIETSSHLEAESAVELLSSSLLLLLLLLLLAFVEDDPEVSGLGAVGGCCCGFLGASSASWLAKGEEVFMVKTRPAPSTFPLPRVGVMTCAPASPRYFRSREFQGGVVIVVVGNVGVVVVVVISVGGVVVVVGEEGAAEGRRGGADSSSSSSSSSPASPVRFNVGGGRFGDGKDS